MLRRKKQSLLSLVVSLSFSIFLLLSTSANCLQNPSTTENILPTSTNNFDLPFNDIEGYKINEIQNRDNPREAILTQTNENCNCSGRGNCTLVDEEYVCQCSEGYMGDNCQTCATGYHSVLNYCLANKSCKEDSCNYNGDCIDDNGSIRCNCFIGYQSSSGEFCNVCAEGYSGYPNCTRTKDANDRSLSCNFPVIPQTFNSIAFLDYSQSFHIFGKYFVDVNHLERITFFSINTPSSFRIVLEDNESINATIFLYSEVDRNLISATSANGFNTIYEYLDNGGYQIYFSFSPNSPVSITDCKFIQMEVEIIPISNIGTVQCDSSTLPLSNYNNQSLLVNYDTPFFYNSSELFYVMSSDTQYFWSFQFQTGDYPSYFLPTINVEVGYEFILGNLLIILEKGTNNHCGDIDATSNSNCVSGQTFYNFHSLQASLQPNASYTLWLYSPHSTLPEINSCFPFTFFLSINSQMLIENEWNCATSRPPETLTSSQYMQSDGSLHLIDYFYIPLSSSSSIRIDINETSIFRMSIDSPNPISISYHAEGDELTDLLHYPNQLSTSLLLEPNTYYIVLSTMIVLSNDASFCVPSKFEMALEPVANISCANSEELLPNVEQFLNISAPFVFSLSSDQSRLYTYTAIYDNHVDNIIFSFPLSIKSASEIILEVESSYLHNNLYITISDHSGIILRSSNLYNLHYIKSQLNAGKYLVSVLFDDANFGTFTPTCADFNFQFILSNIHDCSDIEGQVIPTTLNSLRFLQNSNTMNYFFDSYIPPLEYFHSFSAVSSTTFEVEEVSVFRMYLSPDSSLSISVHIFYYDSDNLVSVHQTAESQIENIQTFALQIEPSFVYYINMTFSQTPGKYSNCPTFKMQIAVGPVDPLPTTCSATNHLPSNFPDDLPFTTYHYDSELSNDIFFLQQKVGRRFYYTTPLILNAYSSVHIEISYNFLTSDTYLFLEDEHSDSYYKSTKSDGKSVIHLISLPPSSYNLGIFQPQNVPSIVGCSSFTFKITIQQYTSSQINIETFTYPPLPTTLNTIQYLGSSGNVKIFDEYYFSDYQNIDFSIQKSSYFRIYITNDQLYTTYSSLYFEGSLLFNSSQSEFEILQKGNYSLHIAPQYLNKAYLLQLEISPTSQQSEYMSSLDQEYGDCTFTPLPTIPTIANGESYKFGSKNQTIHQHYQNAVSSNFVLDVDSYVLFHVGFQFLPNLLSMRLSGRNISISPHSYQINELEIYSFIPAGEYSFAIEFDTDSVTSHCIVYSLIIVISNEPENAGCFNVFTLPNDLNSEYGESSIYGGPIDENGHLSFLGPAFAIFDQLDHFSSIEFSLTNSSMIVVITNSNDAPIQFQLNDGETIIEPTYAFKKSNFIQRAYDVNASTYSLKVFDYASNIPECATYSLSIDIEPSSAISTPPHCYEPLLPSSEIDISVDGFGSDWKESYLPTYLFNQTFTSHFSISSKSTLHCLLSFDIFMSMGKVVLTKNSRTMLTTSSYSPSDISLHTNTKTEITDDLLPGDYILYLSFDQYSYNNGESFDCFPYTWNVQITPYTSSPTILSIYPSSNNYISPDTDITLDLTFSSPLYSDEVRLRNSNSEPIQNSFFLGIMEGSNALDQYPVAVYNIDLFGLVWRLIFSGETLIAGESYLLRLNEGILTDFDESPVILQTINIYRILPLCNEYQHFNFSTYQCSCNKGYTGDHCSQCASGYAGFPNCQPSNYCDPECVNGVCVSQMCNCSVGWAGVSCNFCDDHFVGDECNQCANGWSGLNCDTCAPHFQGASCNQCASHFTGYNCSECETGWTGSDCDTCAPHFEGSNCDQCSIGWDGTDCSYCDYRFTGSNCDQCVYPFTGAYCTECADNFDGYNCSDCKIGWAGEDCSSCAEHYSGSDCNQCAVGWKDPMNGCSECSERFLPPNCTECRYPFTGSECSQCSGNFAGLNCSFCKLGWSGNDCSVCAPHFTGSQCNQCSAGWQGPSCDYCDDRHEGADCDQCANMWYGEDCSLCPHNYQINPGDCSLCAPHFQGVNCSECIDLYTGENCSIPVITGETHIVENPSTNDDDTPPRKDSVIINTIIISIICIVIVCILIVSFLCILKQRKSTSAKMKQGLPTLDLDEESGIEMDTNPIINNRNFDDEGGEFRFNWNNNQDGNNLISFNIANLEDGENEFDGALDLDDLDDFDPRAGEQSANDSLLG